MQDGLPATSPSGPPTGPTRTLVAICTYNEIETLPSLVSAVHDMAPAAHVLIVDDNSPDGTGKWCEQFAVENAWFTCLHRPGKLGLGSAAWAAMGRAIDGKYELLATLDADWSHPPDALPDLLAAADRADVVIGSRYCDGGKVAGWPRRRYVVSRLVNTAAGWFAGLPARDCSTAHRVYRVELLTRVDFDKLHASGYAYLEEILWRLVRAGARIVEVPITFSDRRAGESKVNLGEAWGKLRTLARLSAGRFFS